MDIISAPTMPVKGTISPTCLHSIGASIGSLGFPASAAWPAQYLAIFVPIRVSAQVYTTGMWWRNGPTVNASYKIDVGIYSADLTKLGSTGLTAQGTASVIQSVAINIKFGPGLFYMAMTHNNTQTFYQEHSVTAAGVYRAIGMFQQLLTTPYSLPAVATPAAMGYGYIPLFGIYIRSFI